jgi:hypothetical protein
MAFAISSLLEHPNISGEAAQNENKSPNFTALKEQT